MGQQGKPTRARTAILTGLGELGAVGAWGSVLGIAQGMFWVALVRFLRESRTARNEIRGRRTNHGQRRWDKPSRSVLVLSFLPSCLSLNPGGARTKTLGPGRRHGDGEKEGDDNATRRDRRISGQKEPRSPCSHGVPCSSLRGDACPVAADSSNAAENPTDHATGPDRFCRGGEGCTTPPRKGLWLGNGSCQKDCAGAGLSKRKRGGRRAQMSGQKHP